MAIDCFAECSSYLVVYRAHGDPTLNLIHNTTFPVTISLEIGTYTFLVFEITESNAGVKDIDVIPPLRRIVRIIPERNLVSNDTVTSTVMISVPTSTLKEPSIGNGSGDIVFFSLSLLAHYFTVEPLIKGQLGQGVLSIMVNCTGYELGQEPLSL